MKSKTTLRKHLKQLRALVETNPDPAVQRIAYAMETAIRWASEDTQGWPSMGDEALQLAAFLHQELRAHPTPEDSRG